MSQEQQPRRDDDYEDQSQEPIKYGDVFNVSGDLASTPIAPKDARMMRSAETRVLGQVPPAGPAAVMRAAATYNVQAGLVGRGDVSDAAREQGINISETDVPGTRVVTEYVAGQVVGQHVDTSRTAMSAAPMATQTVITIGQALEAAGQAAGNKPVDQSDAAAIQAAEIRATGYDVVTPGGLATTAQSAATFNAGVERDEDKIKLNYILSGAAAKLTSDKPVSRMDAEGVVSAEMRSSPRLTTFPGGVADSMTAAARMNENLSV